MDESKKILEEINKKYSELYGPIMACCEKYQKYCRCVSETHTRYVFKKNL